MGQVGDGSVLPAEGGSIDAETARDISKMGHKALVELGYNFCGVIELLSSAAEQEAQS